MLAAIVHNNVVFKARTHCRWNFRDIAAITAAIAVARIVNHFNAEAYRIDDLDNGIG